MSSSVKISVDTVDISDIMLSQMGLDHCEILRDRQRASQASGQTMTLVLI